MTAAARALAAAAAAGEFFTVDAAPVGPGWAPLRELTRSPVALDRRLALIRRRLARPAAVVPGEVPLRTTASLDLQGLAARLLSPALGAIVLGGAAVRLTLDSTWWRHGPPRLAVGRAEARPVASVHEAAEALHADLVVATLGPLVAAYGEHAGVSAQVLWGNVASALNGARVVLDAAGLPQRLPAADIVAALTRSTTLAPTVRSLTPRFVRNSCCLYYRIPGAGVCDDCVLTA